MLSLLSPSLPALSCGNQEPILGAIRFSSLRVGRKCVSMMDALIPADRFGSAPCATTLTLMDPSGKLAARTECFTALIPTAERPFIGRTSASPTRWLGVQIGAGFIPATPSQT